MGIFSSLAKGVKTVIDDMNTPQSFKDGEKFEQYVRDYLFPDSHYEMLERTHSYRANKGDYVKSSLNPDFKFRERRTKKVFWVEVKYRADYFNGKVEWCKAEQLKRYQVVHQQTPVFLLLGMGGWYDDPELVSLIPMNEARYVGLFPSVVERFEIEPEKAITSSILW